ncbi:EscU/YscU/HrcU family type III secretion system export apparatus switch protein [Methylocystis parvus]|uniref:Flagellar type III secretion system protein FlhB n=1 Tax=Methylocystis parvus TaxID=134 RepID=A0A6B8M4Q7_9HYPH|nr:EscU/YscU/HrcU family type III secretion system export apparatus switch protein [Methylocystis parvus]QGM97911.1 flagellar type III secretion system protein FlhB [Methylocystis parvus]WBK01777.1 flagellar type III secretion system protein FlhB [Methylocystis parvus OBBP]
MSDSEDAESKTEEATEKKINDTLEQGRTPVSRDVAAALGVLALLACLAFLLDAVGPRLAESLTLLLSNSGALRLRTESDAYGYLQIVGLECAQFLLPILLTTMLSGVVAAFIQGAPRIVFDRVAPDLSRISPKSGWSRLFGLAGLVELAKALIKMTMVGAAVAIVVQSDRAIYVDAMRMEPRGLPSLGLKSLLRLTSVVALCLAALAVADFVWTRFKWRRDLRMSRQELKEEFKQSEGDPFVKARLRSLAADRSRRRMIAAVPKASFVIANPTHYAIALRYVREEGGAPRVVAKGKDLVALKIREVAEGSGVPVLERKDLARAMFDIVEVDKMIPQDFYRPIAELIHFLDRISARKNY